MAIKNKRLKLFILLRGWTRHQAHWHDFDRQLQQALSRVGQNHADNISYQVACIDLLGFGEFNHVTSPILITLQAEHMLQQLMSLLATLDDPFNSEDTSFDKITRKLDVDVYIVALSLAASVTIEMIQLLLSQHNSLEFDLREMNRNKTGREPLALVINKAILICKHFLNKL